MSHQDLKCPQCGGPMELKWSRVFRFKNKQPKPYYRCYLWPECRGSHGAHPDCSPLGIPADEETRKLRTELHAELNKRFPWKTKEGKRATNRWLLQNGFGQGHVSQMNAEEIKSALSILKK